MAESIDKPTALLELKRLDLRYPAGIPPNGKSVRIGRKAEAATMPQLAVEYKRQHPQKVILIRVIMRPCNPSIVPDKGAKVC